MELSQWLVYLSGIGGVFVASWLLERSKWFQSNDSEKRQYIFFGFASGISIAAWAIATFVPASFLTQLAPVFTILSADFAYIFLGVKFHEGDKVAKG